MCHREHNILLFSPFCMKPRKPQISFFFSFFFKSEDVTLWGYFFRIFEIDEVPVRPGTQAVFPLSLQSRNLKFRKQIRRLDMISDQ